MKKSHADIFVKTNFLLNVIYYSMYYFVCAIFCRPYFSVVCITYHNPYQVSQFTRNLKNHLVVCKLSHRSVKQYGESNVDKSRTKVLSERHFLCFYAHGKIRNHVEDYFCFLADSNDVCPH